MVKRRLPAQAVTEIPAETSPPLTLEIYRESFVNPKNSSATSIRSEGSSYGRRNGRLGISETAIYSLLRVA